MRFQLFSFAVGFLALSGCCSPSGTAFHRVHVANPRGETIADWIAKGSVFPTRENEYKFEAVERFTSGPHKQDIHYPYGRKVVADGPNMIVSPCGEPLWLYEGRY